MHELPPGSRDRVADRAGFERDRIDAQAQGAGRVDSRSGRRHQTEQPDVQGRHSRWHHHHRPGDQPRYFHLPGHRFEGAAAHAGESRASGVFFLRQVGDAFLQGQTRAGGNSGSRDLFNVSQKDGLQMKYLAWSGSLLFAGSFVAPVLRAQVSFDRILNANKEPQNWLTYSGNLNGQRYSELAQITPASVSNLEMFCLFQARSTEKFETTPLVVEGKMYITQAPNDVIALDAATGRTFWAYNYTPSTDARPCCGRVNRGVAILGNTLFMATIDSHLIALDATNGHPIWNTVTGNAKAGYAMTLSPLVVKDKVIVGVAGGEYGIRGYIAAYDAKTGKEVWRFYTIPGPGEPGHETWSGDTWKNGGAPAWVTGAYDSNANLTYWGVGNPGPDFHGSERGGDNLYSDCVVALDADTGKLKWYFQFTPHDVYDYDAVQVPVLADMEWKGRNRKIMLWANRNGFY